jgi:acyl-coenzyme A thioesterase PaaI-like protein
MEGRMDSALLDRATDDDVGRALQERLPVHCFGCGVLNAKGLQIRSRWHGDECVCRWQPGAEHIGHPGVVYGGTIASVVDCHAIWTALSHTCAVEGLELGRDALPFAYVTGKLAVNYLKPADIARPLVLRARIVEHGARKSIVACQVMQGDATCATAEVVAVRIAGTP